MDFMNDVAPWVLSLFGLSCFYFVQNGQKVFGWGIGMFNQLLWATYAIATKQWGFLVMVPFYFGMYARGVLKAIKE